MRFVVNVVRRLWRRAFPLPGTTVQIGTRGYIVPEATLEIAEVVFPKLAQVEKPSDDGEVFTWVASVICLCLDPNYPGISPQAMKRRIPARKSLVIMAEVLTAAGFEKPERPDKPSENAAGEPPRP